MSLDCRQYTALREEIIVFKSVIKIVINLQSDFFIDDARLNKVKYILLMFYLRLTERDVSGMEYT